MATFVCALENVTRPDADAIAAHVAWLRALDDAGRLIVCGPFADGDGGLIVFTAADLAQARATAEADPFVVRGCKRARVRELDRAERANGYGLGAGAGVSPTTR